MRHVRAVGIFLEEYVVLAVIISQAVCLIRPVGSRHTMVYRTELVFCKSGSCDWERRGIILNIHFSMGQYLIIYINIINNPIKDIQVKWSCL